MEIEFDPDKDETNRAKHQISLVRASEFFIVRYKVDDRFDYGETRYRAWGLLDEQPHYLAFAVRDGRMRAISLRRCHQKEFDRYVGET